MEAMTAWTDHARKELARAGHRAGGARGEVLELLGRQSCCLSAQEIHDRLRDGGRTVGLASVYRALDALAQLGLVHRIDVERHRLLRARRPERRAPPSRDLRPLRQEGRLRPTPSSSA